MFSGIHRKLIANVFPPMRFNYFIHFCPLSFKNNCPSTKLSTRQICKKIFSSRFLLEIMNAAKLNSFTVHNINRMNRKIARVRRWLEKQPEIHTFTSDSYISVSDSFDEKRTENWLKLAKRKKKKKKVQCKYDVWAFYPIDLELVPLLS